MRTSKCGLLRAVALSAGIAGIHGAETNGLQGVKLPQADRPLIEDSATGALQQSLARQFGPIQVGDLTFASVKLKGNEIPFLGKSMKDLPSKRVMINSLESAKKDSRVPPLPHFDKLEVTLAPNTDIVMRVRSLPLNQATAAKPYPNVEEEERVLGSHRDEFTSLPDRPPSISLLKTLKILHAQHQAQTHKAKDLIAYYVMYKSVRHPPRPVWFIVLRGTDEMGFRPPIRKDIGSSCFVVDAWTGEWLTSGTFLQH